jgi:hypothetical protein
MTAGSVSSASHAGAVADPLELEGVVVVGEAEPGRVASLADALHGRRCLTPTSLILTPRRRQDWTDYVAIADRLLVGDLVVQGALQPVEADMRAGDVQPEVVKQALELRRGQPAGTRQLDGWVANGGHLPHRADEVGLGLGAYGVELQSKSGLRHGASRR